MLADTAAIGNNILFRWVDDNGVAQSPDQMFAIDNVNVVAVAEPSSLALLGVGTLSLLIFSRRRGA